MMIPPKVTVLLPVYNGERYLRRAIESILQQSYSSFEFLIIDDGSTDLSLKIVQSYQDARIRLLENGRNLGLIDSLNRGMGLAKGEYIARMDCDDISLPERLARQVAYLDTHPDIGVLGCGVRVIDACGNPMFLVDFPQENGFIKWSLCFYNPLAHPTVMMRKEVVLSVGGYKFDFLQEDETYSTIHNEDYDLWRRLWRVTSFCNLPDRLLYLRKHADNISKVYLAEQIENGLNINRQILARVLGGAVSEVLIRSVFMQQLNNVDDLCRMSKFMCRLYRRFIQTEAVSVPEKRLIRRDAAERLFRLCYPYIGHNARAWKVLGRIAFIDPAFTGHKILRWLSQCFNVRRRLL
ncbi:MAG: glycosyltransferase [bacterium]|nr:glycosyltransferase [bacterium]